MKFAVNPKYLEKEKTKKVTLGLDFSLTKFYEINRL